MVYARFPIEEDRVGFRQFLVGLMLDNFRRKSRCITRKLNISPDTAMAYFEASVALPQGTIALPLLFQENDVIGFAAIQEMQQPKIVGDMVTTEPYTFIWALYKSPSVGKTGAKELKDLMVLWAKTRGHKMICGNCEPGFKVKAAEKEGFRVLHLVVGMEL